MKRLPSLVSCLALATLAVTGCRSVNYDESKETVAVYQFGEFKMLANATAPAVAAAAEAAFQEFDLYRTASSGTKFNARLEARARNDQRILVNIAEVNSRQTLVRIRWGAGGDLVLSRRLFDAIDRRLGGAR